jgi:hypothetical protein
MIDEFEKKFGHRNPNSTDVHAIWKVKNLVSYFIKYMSKDAKGADVIKGKLWDCSANLKVKDSCEMLLESNILDGWNRARQDEKNRVIDDERFSLCLMDSTQFSKHIIGELKRNWLEYLERIRSYSRVKS